MNYLIYNDIHSIDDFGMNFEILPLLPLSSLSEVENPQISCVLGFTTDTDKLLRIRKWLSTTEGTLRFSFDSRVWNVTNVISSESVKNGTFTVINIIFQVEKLCPLESDTLDISQRFDDIMIYNQGNYDSNPLITIEGEGNITININDNICVIENVNGKVTIDSLIQECWDGDTLDIYSIKNYDFYGEFPIIYEGINYISITSTINISNIEIQPRWVI